MLCLQMSGLENKLQRSNLMEHATSCLNRLFQVACRKKRNFILDQVSLVDVAVKSVCL